MLVTQIGCRLEAWDLCHDHYRCAMNSGLKHDGDIEHFPVGAEFLLLSEVRWRQAAIVEFAF